jgi:methyltransferase
MALMGLRLAVSIPDTVLEDKESPRDKTTKVGLIARACSIYGVDVIEVYRDPGGRSEGGAIRKVLEYLETPQYLRKRLFPLDETLRYAGMLPPLRIPSHKAKVPMAEVLVGEVREGVVNSDGTVDVGLDQAPRLKAGADRGSRVTVRITSASPLEAEQTARERINQYWGYKVEEKQAGEVLSDPRFKTKVATSRLGDPLEKVMGPLESAVVGSGGAKLIFGSPSRGLFDMLGKGLRGQVSFVVNLFPQQYVETVRTEEAIFAGLGLMSLLCAKKA